MNYKIKQKHTTIHTKIKNETNRTWKNVINGKVISEGTKRKRDPQPCFPYYSYTNVGKVNSIQIFIFVILNFCDVPQYSSVASGFCDVRILRYHIFYFKKWHVRIFISSVHIVQTATLWREAYAWCQKSAGGGRHDDSVVTTLGYYICIYFWTYFLPYRPLPATAVIFRRIYLCYLFPPLPAGDLPLVVVWNIYRNGYFEI